MSRHQRGYIFEKHNAFHVRYYAICDGVRKQLSRRLCAKDRSTGHGSPSAKAVRALCEAFMQTVNGEAPPPSTKTVVQFWEETYLPFIKANLKPSTLQGYVGIWDRRLKAHFGTALLREYRTGTATKYLTGIASTLRPRSISTIKNVAQSMYAHAVAIDEAEANPWRDAQVLGKTLPNGVTKVYSLEEIENVITALVDHVDCQLIMALAFFLGLRRGEIGALQWGDLDDKFCHVRRALSLTEVGTPKTLKSVRAVPLIAPVRLLAGLWRSKGTGTGWVFPNTDGGPSDLADVARYVIRPALDRAGVPWKGYHAGRRGLGTALRALTGNSNAGRDVLGHSTDQVTQSHYEAAMPEEALKGMRLLEAQVTSTTLPK